MNLLIPRLARDAALALLEEHRTDDVAAIKVAMPIRHATVTLSPLGGARVDDETLSSLRSDLIRLADQHGFPQTAPREQLQAFEGAAARLLHAALPMTPHEASEEEVWSYLTCCWLLDIALWRFGAQANDERFVGHLNRNAFRRLWWRCEVFGSELPFDRLGEDELVNIMERPTLFADRRVARALATEFLARVDTDHVPERMHLMREATKRLLRLTPFVSLSSLSSDDVALLVRDTFDAAMAGLAGERASMPLRTPTDVPAASPEVTSIATMTITTEVSVDGRGSKRELTNFDEVAQAAIDIARRTGRVTNVALREVAPITAEEARAVLASLVAEGRLLRRGASRGTHYVLPVASPEPREPAAVPSVTLPTRPSEPPEPKGNESALRRLIRRAR
jgi:hypothetical protein